MGTSSDTKTRAALAHLWDIEDALAAAPDPHAVPGILAGFPRCGEAVVELLSGALGAPDEADLLADAPWGEMPLLFSRLDDAQVDALLDGPVFRARHPVVHDALAPAIRQRVPADRAADALIRQLRGGDPLARRNARELAYYLFDASPGYRPDPQRREELTDALREAA